MASRTRTELPTVLVVDDEAPLVRLVQEYLRRDGLCVEATGNGPDAVQMVAELEPTVVVLDLGLPGMDGVEVCRRIRTFSDCYVIMLTARADEVDRLIGLSVGADDYVTKPFSPRELVLRVRAMLRRSRPESAAERHRHRAGALMVDTSAREVWLDDSQVELTPTEFELLSALITEPGTAKSRRELITKVWGEEWIGDEHLVDVHIGNLRRKIHDDPAWPRFIHTVRGVGYKLRTGE
ncbi:response regulator transcription factor [Nesterenkonia sp. MY13]|uniref:Response regulator transcription factor n=1 Tax=Nesterenkonia sedimenti TaxID=1463632 RepID=A0A7X8TK03_9MICC|nr:response regulator transcription factor [Nesterenkonia sedimenti]NLS09959.1 response regulator transcription factor [Nesterenkonia sedimenti]